MSDQSGADTMLDCYKNEGLEVTAKTAGSRSDDPATPAEPGPSETELRAVEEELKEPNRDRKLEEMMEDIKGFIRKIDLNDL